MSDLYPSGFALVIGGSGGVGTAICHELVANNIPVLLTTTVIVSEPSNLWMNWVEVSLRVLNRSPYKTFRLSTARLMPASPSMGDCTRCSSPRGYDIPQSPISDVTPELWQRVMRSDAEGAFNAIHATLPTYAKAVAVVTYTSALLGF